MYDFLVKSWESFDRTETVYQKNSQRNLFKKSTNLTLLPMSAEPSF